jgi:hypothetical protein
MPVAAGVQKKEMRDSKSESSEDQRPRMKAPVFLVYIKAVLNPQLRRSAVCFQTLLFTYGT